MLIDYDAHKEQGLLSRQQAAFVQETAKLKAYHSGRYPNLLDVHDVYTPKEESVFLDSLKKSAQTLFQQNKSLFRINESKAAVNIFMQTHLAISTKNIATTNLQYAFAFAARREAYPFHKLERLLSKTPPALDMEIEGRKIFFMNAFKAGLKPKQIDATFDFMRMRQFSGEMNQTNKNTL